MKLIDKRHAVSCIMDSILRVNEAVHMTASAKETTCKQLDAVWERVFEAPEGTMFQYCEKTDTLLSA
ncbi:MAG: hypothetical protein ACXQS4_05040 [Methermicoccaceae archaeon]